jgi:nitrogen fixation/metabolism regulation signal transduction histidine kinase
MLKFISAVMAAAAFAGVTLLWATNTWIDARARDAAPQSTPLTQTAPAPAAVAISPELVRLEVARDLAVIRNSVEQLANKVEELAAKQDQMSQNTATLQAVQQDTIQQRSPPLSGPVSPPPRKKARRVAPRKLAEQPSVVPPPAFRPQ